MADATYYLQVDWDGTGFANSFPLTFPIVWGTAGAIANNRVRSIRLQYGRDEASQLTGRSRGGTLTAVLDNRSGDYNSFNSGSPLAGTVLPGKAVRVIAESTSEAKEIWRGYLKRIRPQPMLSGDNVAVMEAHGPLTQLNTNNLSLAMRTSELTDVTIKAILDELGVDASLQSLDTGKTTITRYHADRVSPVFALQEIEAAEAGFIWEGKNGQINFDNRHARLSGRGLTSQATFSDASGAARVYSAIRQFDPMDSLFNIFSASVTIYTVASIATLWTLDQVGANSVAINAGDSFTWWANYPNPGTATDGAWGVDAWTTPVATTDWTFNSVAGGGGTNLTGDMTIAVTKFGNSMKMIFTNGHASLTAYVQDLKARGTAITRGDPIIIREEDTTSQTTHNVEREWPAKTDHIPTTAEAYDWAKFHLALYKDPVPMLEMSYVANRSENMLDEMILREIGDRITVVAQNDADLDINGDFFIEAVRHNIRSNKHHVVTYLLSDAEQFSDWWVWGTSKWGTTTRWTY